MLKIFRAKGGNLFFWGILVLLIIGLIGFGTGTGGLGQQNVARVGDREIGRQDYARALDQEVRAISGQLGRALTPDEVRQFGIDRLVLARLIGDAALDGEAVALGLSAGDDTVSAQLMATPAFQGPDGSFSRDAYSFALERAGLDPREFEEMVRRESTRELVAASLQSTAAMPPVAARTVMDFLGERRSFAWIALDAALLGEDRPAADDAALRAFYEANPGRYAQPETREITYAALTPDALAATIELPEEELRAAYDAASTRFNTPERRVVDRIVFGTADEAAEARRRLDAGETDFDALAAERGLRPGDLDQGFVTRAGLDAALGEALFSPEGPGIVGPVTSPLGPALYRINALVAAETVPFETARGELQRELALEQAEADIRDRTAALEDLVAGGATVEEIAREAGMEMGEIALSAESAGGLADDPAFRGAAEAATTGVETDLIALEDGGLAVLRVDTVTPPATIPFEEARETVLADWTAQQTAEALVELGEGYSTELSEGLTVEELAERLERELQTAGPITRGETPPGAPPGLVPALFEAEAGGTVVVPNGSEAVLARITAIEPFDPEADESASAMQALQGQLVEASANDILDLYISTLQYRAGVSVDETALADALEAGR